MSVCDLCWGDHFFSECKTLGCDCCHGAGIQPSAKKAEVKRDG